MKMKRCRRLARDDDVEDVGRGFVERRETRERDARSEREVVRSRWSFEEGGARDEDDRGGGRRGPSD